MQARCTYNNNLFVVDGHKLEDESLWNIFSQLFFKLCGSGITIGQYRYVAKYFANTQLRIATPVDSDDDI